MAKLSPVSSPPFILATSSLLTSLFPIPALIPFILVIAAIGMLMPLERVGILTKLILAILLVLSSNTLIGLIAWLINTTLDASVIVAFYAIVTLGAVYLYPKEFKRINANQKKLFSFEIYAIVFALIAIAIPLKPLLIGADATSLTRILTFTDDNTAHLALVKNIDKFDGYLQGNDGALRDGMTNNFMAYPQGWHLNTVFVANLINEKDNSNSYLLLSYYVTASIWVGLLAYLFTVLAFRLAKPLEHKRFEIMVIAVLLAVGSKFFISTIYPLFTWGAHPQIASFVLMLSVLLLTVETLIHKGLRKVILTAMSLLFIVAISFIYYFELPIVALFALIFILAYYRNYFSSLMKPGGWPLWLFGILLLISLIPIVIYFHYIGTSQASVFNASGGTLSYSNFLIVAVSLSALVYAWMARSISVLWIGIMLACATIFMLAIFAFQLYSTGVISYYGFKASQTVVLLSAIVICVFFINTLGDLLPKKQQTFPAMISLSTLLVVGLSLTKTYNAPLYDIYIDNNPYGIDKELASEVVNAASGEYPERFISIGSCASYEDVRAMSMVIALSGKTTPLQREISNTQFDSAQEQKVFDLIKKYQSELPANSFLSVVSSNKQTGQGLVEALGPAAKRIDVKDLSIHEQNNAICPLRLQ